MPALQTLVPAGCPEDGDLSAAAARTCYSDHTEVAAGLLDRCRERLRAPGPSAGPDDRELAQRAARDVAAALVQLGAVASISPGPASLFFALSVIFTMLSAQSFDSRMIWDHDSEATGPAPAGKVRPA